MRTSTSFFVVLLGALVSSEQSIWIAGKVIFLFFVGNRLQSGTGATGATGGQSKSRCTRAC